MKLAINDIVTVNTGGQSLSVKVEDASKGDIIQGKVETSASAAFEVGKVYEFDRKDIAG